MRKGLLMVACVLLVRAPLACAWDSHWMLTQQTLQGFSTQDPALFKKLTTQTIQVTPMEEFLARAFGSQCTWDVARDRVFDGIGKNYQVYYARDYQFSYTLDWDKGLNDVHTEPVPDKPGTVNPQALGQWVHPFDVLTVYSDEPDRQMDDDVARLAGKGPQSGTQGEATRMLRHFWYKGETHFGVDFGAGEETDKRMQLYYELALVAFNVNEPYWGYRFLADALHYIQDLTQPFHIHALIDTSMVNILEVAHSYLCDDMRKQGKTGPQCKSNDNLHTAVIWAGWSIGTYHLMYEEFARSLFVNDVYGTREWVAASHASEPVLAQDANGLLDFSHTPDAERKIILTLSDAVGRNAYAVFGSKFKYDQNACEMQFQTQDTPHSDGFRLGGDLGDDDEDLLQSMKQSQVDAIYPLVAATHAVLGKAADWGRAYLREALASSDQALQSGVSLGLRRKYAQACGSGWPPP